MKENLFYILLVLAGFYFGYEFKARDYMFHACHVGWQSAGGDHDKGYHFCRTQMLALSQQIMFWPGISYWNDGNWKDK